MPAAYPSGLRGPLLASRSRSQPAAFSMSEPRRGYAYVQATGTDTPVIWDLTFRFTAAEAKTFQDWFIDTIHRGVDEWTLPITTEYGSLVHTVRFLPDGLLDASQDGSVWTYKASIMARAQLRT